MANTQPTKETKGTGDSRLHSMQAETSAPPRKTDDETERDEGSRQAVADHEGREQERGLDWKDLSRIILVAAAAAAFWFLGPRPIYSFTILGVICTVAGGYPIFREALENIVERRMTMELSMAIAIFAALAIHEVFTALVITLFVLVAEVLEGLTVGRGRRAIQHLIDLLPGTATVRRHGIWKEVAIREILAGDVVLVRPGGRIPVDGSVVGGHSFVDQATITGESMAVEKRPGAIAYAGTINQSGALEVCVERLGRDTTFGKIIEAVERAEQSRAPIQKIADRLAGYLVYFALAAAALTFLITHNVRSTISVVIVAGACGIAAGTPLAILGAIGRAAQQGAIIKGGLYLEKLAKVDVILLDKTGTLTYGTPEVLDIRPAAGVEAGALLEAAVIAESRSEHPVAKAILKKAAEFTIPSHLSRPAVDQNVPGTPLGFAHQEPEGFEYTPGKGVVAVCDSEEIIVGNRLLLQERGVDLTRADGLTTPAHLSRPAVDRNVPGSPDTTPAHQNVPGSPVSSDSEVFVSRGGKFLGTLLVADMLRPEASQAINALKSMRLRTVLLTGDAKSVAEEVGKKLGVDEIASELLPEEKLQYVIRLAENRHTVAMVGDGVNDAPALMQAAVGVAMGSGTDVARESADVVLIGNDLSKLVETLRIARRCRRTIMQNFVGTLMVDSVGVGLAAFGFLNPLLAAFIHVSSEMAFILNSARLLPSASAAGRLARRASVRSQTTSF